MSLESLINKATDGALTSDNWQYILDVCDIISSDPEKHIPRLIKAIKARLGEKDANIVLRSLTLLVAMGENCGSRMQQQIASLTFLKEALLSRLADRKVHKELKFRIAEVLQQLDRLFLTDPSLKAVADAYNTVKTRYLQYLKLPPPSKPAKTELTPTDRRNEDLELERALKLSVQEYEREQTVRKSYLDSKPLPEPSNARQNTGQNTNTNLKTGQNTSTDTTSATSIQNAAVSDGTVSIANVKKVYALYDLISYEPDELSFRKGDVITVLESVYRDWWRGSLPNGKTGIFPLNYVTPVVSKTPEELARELKLEAALMDHELKKVDRLLALLSLDPNSVLEEEVTSLYNGIVHLKPVLAQLIGKHSARKDELRVLNEQVNAETKAYNDSIDASIANRQAPMLLNYSGLPYPSAQQSGHKQGGTGQNGQNGQNPVLGHYRQNNQTDQHSHGQTAPYHPTQNPHSNALTSGAPHQPQFSSGYLDQQPTSAGFGNGQYFQPNEQVSYGYSNPLLSSDQPQQNNPGQYPAHTTFPQRNY